MGSAAAVFAAGELGHRVHGYILESPYQDLKVAVWNRVNVALPPVLSHAAYAGSEGSRAGVRAASRSHFAAQGHGRNTRRRAGAHHGR